MRLVSGFFQFLARFGFDYFIIGLLAMIGLAWVYPSVGLGEGVFSLTEISGYAVSLIFFFYGLRLSREKLRADLYNWKLHLTIQAATFVLFPALILAVKPLFIHTEANLLWMGAFFLASLPSTVSSSVVMVSIAEGNIAASIFNASISGILGVVITPLWCSLVLGSEAGSQGMGPVVGKLFLQVLLPVMVGMALNPKFGNWAENNKQKLKYFDQIVILSIIYTSFCKSFSQNLFKSLSFWEIIVLACLMLSLFFTVFVLISILSRWLGFSRVDKIAAVFCGSKKSLVHGTVMSKVLFQNSLIVGILLLPLMLYHALQLIAASMIAQKIQKQNAPIRFND